MPYLSHLLSDPVILRSSTLTPAMLNILLLEDAPADAELICTALNKAELQFELVNVATRQEFTAAIDQQLPDIVLADYQLPSFDGLTALNIVRNEYGLEDLPFIIVSGVLGEERAIDTLQQGATDYVLKQRLERLVPAVERAVREQQERRDRKRIEGILKQTDYLLRAIVQASPVGIITLDPEQRVLTWNKGAEKMYGWSASDVIEQPFPGISTEQRSQFESILQKVLQGQEVNNLETIHCRSDQTTFFAGLSLAPILRDDGTVYAVVMIASDISLQKQLEADRLRLLQQEQIARREAEAANRMKDEFLAVISHELRTPINPILGWANLLLRSNLDEEKRTQAVESIRRNAELQKKLVDDLLDISSIIRGDLNLKLRPIPILSVVRSALDDIQFMAEQKNIQIEALFAAETGIILGDQGRLQQVFSNLLSNALKFTPSGGQITVICDQIDDKARIAVMDTGQGIPADFLPHIFDRFRQLDSSLSRSQSGLGIGLSLAKELVEMHDGSINVKSPGRDQGTTFTIELPLIKESHQVSG